MCGLIWGISEAQRTRSWWAFALVGGVLGLFTLNRENAAVFFPVILAWVAVISISDGWRGILAQHAIVVLAAAAMLLPVGVRNYYVGGEFLLTTSQMGPNFYIGNHANADGRYSALRPNRGDPRYERLDARALAEAVSQRRLSPSEVSQFWMARAESDIRSDSLRWLKLLGWKALLTFHTTEIVDAEGLRGHARESWMLRLLSSCLTFGVLCPIAAVGWWLTRSDWRRLWILYALLIAFAAAVTLFYVFARYRYPLVPLVVLFAAAGLSGVWDRLRRGAGLARRELWISAALALPIAVVCNWPLAFFQGVDEETTLLNIGNSLIDQGRPADAIAPLEALRDAQPDKAAALVMLGVRTRR